MDSYQPVSRNGLECLLDRYRNSFRIPENINHYSKKDFKSAEKKYIKYCINYGFCGISFDSAPHGQAGR